MPVDMMGPHTPPGNFYQVAMGMWVEFNVVREGEQCKRHGWVRTVEDMHVLVIDEYTLAEVRRTIYSKEG